MHGNPPPPICGDRWGSWALFPPVRIQLVASPCDVYTLVTALAAFSEPCHLAPTTWSAKSSPPSPVGKPFRRQRGEQFHRVREQNLGCGEEESVGLGSSFRVFVCGLSTFRLQVKGAAWLRERFSFVFFKFIFNWRIIAWQYCAGFWQTSAWISHRTKGYLFLKMAAILVKASCSLIFLLSGAVFQVG